MCHHLPLSSCTWEKVNFVFRDFCGAGGCLKHRSVSGVPNGAGAQRKPCRSRDQPGPGAPEASPFHGVGKSFWDPPAPLAANAAPAWWAPSSCNRPFSRMCSGTKPRAGAETDAKWQNLTRAGLADGAAVSCFLQAPQSWPLLSPGTLSAQALVVAGWGWRAAQEYLLLVKHWCCFYAYIVLYRSGFNYFDTLNSSRLLC